MTALACSVCAVRVFVTSKTRRAYKCGTCGVTLCGRHVCFYIDESNAAVNRNAPALCAIDCDVFENRNTREVGFDNLLLSGDYPHRDAARARFRVILTPTGSRIA